MTVQLNFRFNQRARNLVCADNTDIAVNIAQWTKLRVYQIELFAENVEQAEEREVPGQLFECPRSRVENV